MKLFVCLAVGWIFLNACAVYGAKTQQMGLWVWKTFPEQKDKEEKGLHSRETFFQVGSTIQMICTYMDTYCDDKESTSFSVYHRTSTLNIHEVNRTKCALVFEVQNLTLNDQGFVVCNDTINGHFRQRNFQVGYPPVPPENLTIVFKPRRSLVLLLDRVKTGTDLNEPGTMWNVAYTWRKSVNCSKEGQQIDTEDGRFIACYLKLKDKYEGDGQYGSGLGNIYSPINFTITVENIFGATPAVSRTYYPYEYVKPSSLTSQKIQVRKRGETWILLNVTFPHGIEKQLCKNMSENRSSAFKTEYTVTSMSEEMQQNQRNRTKSFHELYGCYRNLESDKAALNSTDTFSTSIPFKQVVFEWPDCETNYTMVNITGLPLPNTYYNISMRFGGRYWSSWLEVDTSKGTKTAETVPSEGPQFYDSFYFCLRVPPENECVKCVVYFKEIPRALRGGDVLKYTLNGARSGSSDNGKNCSNAKQFTVETDGEHNTIVVENLTPQAVYNLRLWATVAKGLSPESTATLNTSANADSVVKSLDVVVERHGGMRSYDASWSVPCTPGAGAQECPSNISYYVHYCFVKSNQLDQPNCKTNLVTELVNSSTRIKSVPFQHGCFPKDLEPAVFVSMQTPDGAHSPLVKPECHYDVERGTYQDVSWLDVENQDGHTLLVRFQHKCPYLYFGRPNKLCVAVTELTDVKAACPKLLDKSQIFCEEDMKLKVPMERTFSDLKPDSDYCVGIKALKRSSDSVWDYKIEKTRLPEGNNYAREWIIIATTTTIFAAIAVIILLIYCCSRCKKKARRFEGTCNISKIPEKQSQQSLSTHTLLPRDLPPKNPSIEGRSNAVFLNMPVDNDSGVALSRAPSDKSAEMTYNNVDQSQEHRQRHSSRVESRSENDDISQPNSPLSASCNQPIFRSRYGFNTPGPSTPKQPQEDDDVDDGDDANDSDEDEVEEVEDDDVDYDHADDAGAGAQCGECSSNIDNINCQEELSVVDGIDQFEPDLLKPLDLGNDRILEAMKNCPLAMRNCPLKDNPFSPLSMQPPVPVTPCTVMSQASDHQTERKGLLEGEPSLAEKIETAEESTDGFSRLEPLEDSLELLAAASCEPQPMDEMTDSDTATASVVNLKNSLAVQKSGVEEDSSHACTATSAVKSIDGCMNKEGEVCATGQPSFLEESDILDDFRDLDSLLLEISKDPILLAAKNCGVNSPSKLSLQNGILLKPFPQCVRDSGVGDLTCDGNFDDSSEEAETSLLLHGDKETANKNTNRKLTQGGKSKHLGSEKRLYCKVTEK